MHPLDQLLAPLFHLGGPAGIDAYMVQNASYHLQSSRFRTALYSVFWDLKRQFGVAFTGGPSCPKADPALFEQQQRLDEMLANENVIAHPVAAVYDMDGFPSTTGPNTHHRRIGQQPPPTSDEHSRQLARIRDQYSSNMFNCDGSNYELNARVMGTLQQHSLVRPIVQEDLERMWARVGEKFAQCRVQLKLNACQSALALRSKMDERRHKRRNFSRASVAVLNEYFQNHLDNPYPNDEVKRELAARSGLTLVQVANWFGNKRIRHRAKERKMQQQKEDEDDEEEEGDEGKKEGGAGKRRRMMMM